MARDNESKRAPAAIDEQAPVVIDEQAPVAADKPARGEMPEWKKAEYNGPLTINQAVFRNERYTHKGGRVVAKDGFKMVEGIAVDDVQEVKTP